MECKECGVKLNKKNTSTCMVCGKVLCLRHAYYYQDESNIAITKNSKAHCRECYRLKYRR